MGMEMEIKSTPVPEDDSKIHTSFNHEGVLWQKRSFSKNVLGWSSLPSKKVQMDSNNNNLGEYNMIKEKVIKTHNF